MAKPPPVPPEQRPANDAGEPRLDDDGHEVTRDPGGVERNLAQQGRHGDIRQNTTHQGLPRGREPG